MSILHVVAVAGALLLGASSAAQPGSSSYEGKMGRRMGEGAGQGTELDIGAGMPHGGRGNSCFSLSSLTKEQAEKIAAINKESDPRREKFHTDRYALKKQLRDLKLQKANKEKTRAIEGKMDALDKEIFKFEREIHVKVQALLTPEQKAACTFPEKGGMDMEY